MEKNIKKNVCVELSHFTVQQKSQHCKSTILQLKNTLKIMFLK